MRTLGKVDWRLMTVKAVFHTGVTVSNLDISIPFYRDVLGLRLKFGPTPPASGQELSQAVGVEKAVARLAILEAENGDGLELVEYLSPPSPLTKPAPANALGAAHLALLVEDLDQVVERLRAKGVEFLSPAQVVDEGPAVGWHWVYLRDPDGIAVELIALDERAHRNRAVEGSRQNW